MSAFRVVIPARYASTRLPGKPLREIGGRPMILHVCERARASGAREVIVATDDERIERVVTAAGFDACMTDPAHPSGTDRIVEVVERRGWSDEEIVVNLQGDEPDMPAKLLTQVARALSGHSDAVMATLGAPLESIGELDDPNVVKLVSDRHGYALYFSRAPIPWYREHFANGIGSLPKAHVAMRHIGLYAYRVGFLKIYANLPVSPLEQAEALEQLRVLWNGYRIAVRGADERPGRGVDTAEDLRRILDEMGCDDGC